MWIEQNLYNVFLRTMPIVCVDVAIIHEAEVLLVLRDREPANGEWWLPGGRLEKGEGLKECAHRKALEETGLDCRIGPMIYYGWTMFETGPYNIPVHSVNFCYLAYPYSDRIKLDNTSRDYKWIDKINIKHNDYIVNCLMEAGFDY